MIAELNANDEEWMRSLSNLVEASRQSALQALDADQIAEDVEAIEKLLEQRRADSTFEDLVKLHECLMQTLHALFPASLSPSASASDSVAERFSSQCVHSRSRGL